MQTKSFSIFWHSLRILKVITVWCLGSDWVAPGWEWGVRPGRRRVRSSPGTGNWDKHEPYLAKCHQQTVTNCPLNIKETLSLFIKVKCSFSYWHHDREWMLVWPGWDAPSHPSPSIAYSFTPHHHRNHSWKPGSCWRPISYGIIVIQCFHLNPDWLSFLSRKLISF